MSTPALVADGPEATEAGPAAVRAGSGVGEPDDGLLPIASRAEVRAYARAAARRHRRGVAEVTALQGLATAAGLVGPAVLGHLVDAYSRGRGAGLLGPSLVLFGGAIVVESLFSFLGKARSARLGEQVLAELREGFVADAVTLPLGTVELAGSGELVSRATTDVERLADSVRMAAPAVLTAVVAVAVTVGALVLTSPILAGPAVAVAPLVIVSTRWYRRRSPATFRSVMASWARVSGRLQETADAARTVEALHLGPGRLDRVDRDIDVWLGHERRALFLEAMWFPAVDGAYALAVAGTLLCGGLLHAAGWVSLGQATAATLYVRQLVEPVDDLIGWLDELQRGATALGRVRGVGSARAREKPARPGPPVAGSGTESPSAGVPAPATPPIRGPAGRSRRGEATLRAAGVRFGYRPGREVLRGVDLEVRPGERIAVVGPSGAGKSSLGRLLAGVHRPGAGRVTFGGADLAGLPVEELRRRVVLVTQEHHVFTGTLADNLRLGRPDASAAELAGALAAVGADGWVDALPAGPDTVVGSGGEALTGGRSQQVALARLVLADPAVIVLDEATAALDPRTARHTERALAAVMAGRTVVAIAHRLFTAHDADRIAVVDGGLIVELGRHDELLAAAGPYAALWRSWRSAS